MISFILNLVSLYIVKVMIDYVFYFCFGSQGFFFVSVTTRDIRGVTNSDGFL